MIYEQVHPGCRKDLDAICKFIEEYIVSGVFIDMCTRSLVTDIKLQSVLVLSLVNCKLTNLLL